MSTWTKIAVIVLVVLVLIATPIFITQAAAPMNWKAAYKAADDRRVIAEAEAYNAKAANEVLLASLRDQTTRNQTLTSQLQSDADKNRQEITRLSEELAARKSDFDLLTANYQGLETELRNAVAFNKSQAEEMAKLQKENIGVNDRLRKAYDTLAENDSNIRLLTQANQSFQQQVVQKDEDLMDLRHQLDRAKAGGGVSSAAGSENLPAAAAAAGPKVEGSVTAVKGNLASLNVGEASGVKKGMRFILYRGPDFVANLDIAQVDAASSAGVIVDAQREVKQGDKATTKIEGQ